MPGTARKQPDGQLADFELAEIGGEQEARAGAPFQAWALRATGDPLQRFLGLLEKAPEVEAALDEKTDGWTVLLPPPTDLDAAREVRGSLADATAEVTDFLARRDHLLQASILAQLDVLHACWGERFEIGWDGEWWCQSRDSTGEPDYASSPEELNRLMGERAHAVPVHGCSY